MDMILSRREGFLILTLVIACVFSVATFEYYKTSQQTVFPEEQVLQEVEYSSSEKPFVKVGSKKYPWYDVYEGEVIVSGTYHYMKEGLATVAGLVCFRPEGDSSMKIPQVNDSREPYFCLFGENKEIFEIDSSSLNDKRYCSIEGKATIMIRGYDLLRSEIGAPNLSTLSEIIDKENAQPVRCLQTSYSEASDESHTLYTNRGYGFSFEYPSQWRVEPEPDGIAILSVGPSLGEPKEGNLVKVYFNSWEAVSNGLQIQSLDLLQKNIESQYKQDAKNFLFDYRDLNLTFHFKEIGGFQAIQVFGNRSEKYDYPGLIDELYVLLDDGVLRVINNVGVLGQEIYFSLKKTK